MVEHLQSHPGYMLLQAVECSGKDELLHRILDENSITSHTMYIIDYHI